MKRTLFALVLAASAAACSSQKPTNAAPAPAMQRIVPPGLGVSFELPADWTAQTLEAATVYSAPAGTAAFFATVAMQAMAAPSQPLESTLDESYAAWLDAPKFQWEERTEIRIATIDALRYGVRFEKDEVLRRQAGVFFDRPPHRINLRFGAPQSSYDTYQWVFERLVQSLQLEPLEPAHVE